MLGRRRRRGRGCRRWRAAHATTALRRARACSVASRRSPPRQHVQGCRGSVPSWRPRHRHRVASRGGEARATGNHRARMASPREPPGAGVTRVASAALANGAPAAAGGSLRRRAVRVAPDSAASRLPSLRSAASPACDAASVGRSVSCAGDGTRPLRWGLRRRPQERPRSSRGADRRPTHRARRRARACRAVRRVSNDLAAQRREHPVTDRPPRPPSRLRAAGRGCEPGASVAERGAGEGLPATYRRRPPGRRRWRVAGPDGGAGAPFVVRKRRESQGRDARGCRDACAWRGTGPAASASMRTAEALSLGGPRRTTQFVRPAGRAEGHGGRPQAVKPGGRVRISPAYVARDPQPCEARSAEVMAMC